MELTRNLTPSIYELYIKFYETTGILKTDGSGTKTLMDNGKYSYSLFPGQLAWFIQDDIPEGYLPLCGQTYNRYNYVELFEAQTKTIDIEIIDNKTFKYNNSNKYLINFSEVSLESPISLPLNTYDVNKPYYIININDTANTLQLSKTKTGNPISLLDADVQYIKDNMPLDLSLKLRFYPGVLIQPGDYSTTFTLFDARGYFLRAVDVSEREVGSIQEDAFQGHWHFDAPSIYSFEGNGQNASNGIFGRLQIFNSPGIYQALDGNYGIPRVADETRPKNIAAHLCIKY